MAHLLLLALVVTESSPSKSPQVKSEPTTGFNNKKTEGTQARVNDDVK